MMFISKDEYQSGRKKQIEMTTETLQQLREYGVGDSTQLKLEYFFYTNQEAKAVALAGELQNKDYSAETERLEGDEESFLITGWTDKMLMTENTVTNWVGMMCDLGFKHDCEFDGWGTNPEQTC